MNTSSAFIRTVSSKGNNDGGEVTDAEGDSRSTSQRSLSGEGLLLASTREDHMEQQKGVLVAEDEEMEQTNEDEEDDDDEEDDYEYEDDDDAAFAGFLVDNPAIATAATLQPEAGTPATIEEETTAAAVIEQPPKQKWRQPSEQAVSMSLRAEREKSGGKRRLAQDLYRIMNQDTEEAGFSLQPSSEDCMDKWTINLFQFDEDSNLAKDMKVLGLENIELEMSFPDQYPFEPPFVRVTRPRFKRQTGFVMNGALCMELLTKDGWNPINDIESVIVSIRSLLVVGDGRLEAAYSLPDAKYKSLLEAATAETRGGKADSSPSKRQKCDGEEDDVAAEDEKSDGKKKAVDVVTEQQRRLARDAGGSYSVSEAEAAYTHLSDYHKKKGWDTSGWWARKG